MPDLRSPRVWLAMAWSAFQLYTAYAGLYDLLIQLPVHVAFAIALGFLTEPTPDSPEAAARLPRGRPGAGSTARWRCWPCSAPRTSCGTTTGWRPGWPWWTIPSAWT